MVDDYEGDYTTRRVLLYTLRFSAKTYLFGPVSSTTTDIIKKGCYWIHCCRFFWNRFSELVEGMLLIQLLHGQLRIMME